VLRMLGKVIMVSLFVPLSAAFAADFHYKKVEDFKKLESYRSVEQFESTYKTYAQDCLDNTGGGTGGIRCFIGNELWDRELNIYYSRLMKVLSEKERTLLKKSQLAWVREIERTIDFNSAMLDKKYREIGTMHALQRAGEAEGALTPVVKQRTLFLKHWLEYVGNEKQKTPVHNN
jgi:uncharacterized protein YecT (DUF1311 family)